MSKDETLSDIEALEAKPTVSHDEGDQEFTAEEDRRVTRKLDIRIIPVLIVTYALFFLDKATFGASVLYGAGIDLGIIELVGMDPTGKPITDNSKFSNATMIYYVGFVVGVYPWGVIAQKFPKSKVISVACVAWSAIGIFTILCKNYTGIMLVRFFLGICEAGVPSTFTVYVSYWWSRKQQVTRSAAWYCAGGAGSMIGPVMGWGTAHIQGSLKPWQYMFLVINAISAAWGIAIWFLLPDSPATASFLNERERALLLAKMKKNQAGNMSTKFDWKHVREAVLDSNFWFLVLFSAFTSVPVAALSNFASIVIQGLGFNQDHALLLTTPLGAMTVLSLLGAAFICRKWPGNRYWVTIGLLLIELAGALLVWQSPIESTAPRYIGLLLFPTVVAASGMGVSLVSSNVAGNTKKYVTGGTVFIGQCVGSISGSLLFGASPGPRFDAGFIGNTAFTCGCILITIMSRFALARENKKRDAEGEHEEVGLDMDLTDKQNRRFRYEL